MAIIGKVERESWGARLLNLLIHLILLLGAATMVYPLLIMISGSISVVTASICSFSQIERIVGM